MIGRKDPEVQIVIISLDNHVHFYEMIFFRQGIRQRFATCICFNDTRVISLDRRPKTLIDQKLKVFVNLLNSQANSSSKQLDFFQYRTNQILTIVEKNTITKVRLSLPGSDCDGPQKPQKIFLKNYLRQSTTASPKTKTEFS